MGENDFDPSLDDEEAKDNAEASERKGDPIAHLILQMARDSGTRGVSPQEVAKAYFAEHRRPREQADDWRRYMVPVKQQIQNMARRAQVEIVRGERVQDPSDYKGLIRVRLPRS